MFNSRLLSVSLQVLLAGGYSLVAAWALRRYGLRGLVAVWVVSAAALSGALAWRLTSPEPGVPAGSFLALMVLTPVLMTAGSSLLIWRLHRRARGAGRARVVLHGLAGWGLGILAALLGAMALDVSRRL